jgi:mannose-6-phosphate isomerase
MHPLIFQPIYRTYLWGGRRFETRLERPLPAGETFAESWELVDRGDDQSVVAAGPLAKTTLGSLVREQGRELMGRHDGIAAFPLLFKFLDARLPLSVQVHPDDTRAGRLDPPDRGKTEAWYVVDAEPGSLIYAGLREGVTAADLAAAIACGNVDRCLHSFEATRGDCIFIPAGTVHAIGAGLLIAEIQQSSDVTYRLFDWNRVGPDGRPRPLHIEAGIDAVTCLGPVAPRTAERRAPGTNAASEKDAAIIPLVACEYFILDLCSPAERGESVWAIGGDDSPHFVAVLSGTLQLDPSWEIPPLGVGRCVLLPASLARQPLRGTPGTQLLHITIPAPASPEPDS